MTCLLCQSSTSDIFDRVESFGYPLVYYQCGHCGLVYQNPEESQAADPVFYAETYRRIYQSSPEPTQKDLWVQAKRASHLMRLLEKQGFSAPKRVLDIGASAGLLLDAFRSAYDCQVMGVEPGDAYRAYTEKQGLSMVPSLDALVEKEPRKFDLVSLMHVLEHLVDPVETLKIIRQSLLADSGVLLLEVPNFYAHDSYELAHLACYSPHTLKVVLQQAGYHVLSIKAHGIPRSMLLPLYLTVLAEPLPEGGEDQALHPEHGVKIKRQVGMFYRRLMQKLFPHRAWLPLPEEKEV